MPRFAKTSLLFASFLICAAAVLVAHQWREQIPAPAPHDLFVVVNQQLTDLRSADFRSAYRRAAAGVQEKFTPKQFEKMVRQRYPEMTRSARVEFGLVRERGPDALVQVFFFGDDGSVRSFLFTLINEGDAWKINAVEEAGDELERCPFSGTQA